jgi:hypothetical protein
MTAEAVSKSGDLGQVEALLASKGMPRPSWLAVADVRVRDGDVVVRMPPSLAGAAEAQTRYALAQQMGIVPVVGVLGGTVGRSFVFIHVPDVAGAGRVLTSSAEVDLRVWPVNARAHAWRQRTVWWRLTGAAKLKGLLSALGLPRNVAPGAKSTRRAGRRRTKS